MKKMGFRIKTVVCLNLDPTPFKVYDFAFKLLTNFNFLVHKTGKMMSAFYREWWDNGAPASCPW